MEHTEIKYQGGKKFVALNRGHKVIIDLPEGSGGSDQGPTPPEVFIDSIGTCIGVYVAGYCKSVGLNTEGLTIKIGWEKQVKEKPYYIEKIDVKIDLPKADIGQRKKALLKVAHSCMIHQTIKTQPHIGIDLV